MRDPHVLTRRSEVGRRLREFRHGSGLTQGELARTVKIGQASLSNYESGKRELPLGVAVNLAGALAISLGDLLDIPDILVVRDARMGRALRALAASPRLLDSVVPPVEPEPEQEDADGDEPDDGSGEDDSGGDDDNGSDHDDDDGAHGDGATGADDGDDTDEGDTTEGDTGANDRGDADGDDGPDADEVP